MPSASAQPGSALSHVLRDAVNRHAGARRTALLDAHGSLSYAELGRLIDRYAGGVRAWNVRRGELVGIAAARSADAIALFFGVMQAGACPCFMEPRLSPDAARSRMAAVGMSRLVVDADASSAASALPAVGIQVRTLADLRGAEAFCDDALQPEHSAMMLFTSGSTGQPKGVLLSHAGLLCNAEGVMRHTGITPDDRLLHVMPLHHTNGINNQLIAPFLAGASVALIEKFSAEQTAAQIDACRATYMTGVPTMYSRMLPYLTARARPASLRFLRCGSAPITTTLHEAIEAAFEVPLVVSYGLSEATCTSTMNPPHARKVGTVGTVLAGQQVRLFQPGGHDETAAGSEGEIRITGPALMKGYVGAGAEQPIENGWLRTGDLGQFDADGYLRVTGRIKDVIIRGGENLSPQLIESVIAAHAGVKSCCVVGAPHADLGEVPVAFVVLGEDWAAHASAEELKVLVQDRLSRVYTPSEVRFVQALPENSVGKIDRKALKQAISNSEP